MWDPLFQKSNAMDNAPAATVCVLTTAGASRQKQEQTFVLKTTGCACRCSVHGAVMMGGVDWFKVCSKE